MYVYLEPEKGLFTVGFYKPDGTWRPEADCANRAEARALVNYLNGGTPLPHWSLFWEEGVVVDDKTGALVVLSNTVKRK